MLTRFHSILLGFYLGLGIFTISNEGWSAPTGFYVLAVTISTVGIGDVAPVKDASRIITIFGIPFGLTILGLILSISVEYKRSLPPILKVEESEKDTQIRAVFAALDADSNGELDVNEMMESAAILGLSRERAKALFEALDVNKSNLLIKPELIIPWQDTLPGEIFVLVSRLYAVVFCGALMIMVIDQGINRDLTWIDAFYFASVVSTSVG